MDLQLPPFALHNDVLRNLRQGRQLLASNLQQTPDFILRQVDELRILDADGVDRIGIIVGKLNGMRKIRQCTVNPGVSWPQIEKLLRRNWYCRQ